MDLLSGVSSVWPWLDARSLLLFALVLLVTAEYLRARRPSSFPPGPRAFPLVGNMFSIDSSKPHRDMTELAEKYGNVYSLRMGPSWAVVLNGLSALQEGLCKGDQLSDRPEFPLHSDVLPSMGIVFSNGHVWKQQRRFAIITLKYFGLGRKSLESSILDEFIYISKEISKHKGKLFNPHLIMNNAVSNIICTLVFGHRFEYSDEMFQKMIKLLDKGTQIESSIWAQLYNAFPVLMRHLPGRHRTLQKIYGQMTDFVKTEIEKHKKDWNPSDPRDFIDCYLTEIQKHQDKSDDEPDAGFHEDNLVMCTFDLFGAGTETTSTTLRWALLYMVKYPEIQEKVQAEIDRVIGQSRQPSMEDRAHLPYTDAVIHEIQRMSNIVPLSLPHVTNRDIQLGGYTIPKGVTIIPNLTSVLSEKNEWETPHTFNPGHFLNEEGKFVKRAAFLPFSAGKRVCLGENLARMELFLFFTSFMQRFSFSMPPGVEPVFKALSGVTLTPLPYEICATPRKE
ncbi:cytochrome P450 2J4-like [Anoplopoma fimbria]|uniref:cytochrome P450 2J4-like n=1 Tax=Anoplopoma fimbria TaxID=229290 RepID=UPI0023ECB2DC|nr:cytochrome P450 2J4-like [Anoplopoma fimbria]